MQFILSISGMFSGTVKIFSQIVNSYRLVPTFGRGTIRRFKEDVSAMKKLAARNWEDLIQVRS